MLKEFGRSHTIYIEEHMGGTHGIYIRCLQEQWKWSYESGDGGCEGDGCSYCGGCGGGGGGSWVAEVII